MKKQIRKKKKIIIPEPPYIVRLLQWLALPLSKITEWAMKDK